MALQGCFLLNGRTMYALNCLMGLFVIGGFIPQFTQANFALEETLNVLDASLRFRSVRA